MTKKARLPAAISWPWRGLGLAALLALAAHWGAYQLSQSSSAFSFSGASQAAALNTRILTPVALPTPPTPTPQSQPLSPPAAAPKRTPSAAVAKTVASELSAQSVEKAPVEEVKIDSIKPIESVDTALSATENVANIPRNNEVDPIRGLEQITPELKLAYPASVALQFAGRFVRKGSMQTGSGVLNWSSNGVTYRVSLEATALVILSQTEISVGTLSPLGLQPQTYSSKRTGRSEQATHFRGDIGKIQFSNNKPDASLLPGAQDRVSAFVQLAGIIGGDPEKYKAGDRIQMQVAGLDNAEVWEFVVEGMSEVVLPAGQLQAVKLNRAPRNEFDQRIEIWLAPELGYLPARIRQSSSTTPSQDFFELVLSKLP